MNLMKKTRTSLVLLISIIFTLILFSNFSFSSSIQFSSLSKGIIITPLGLNNTTYVFSKLNISINVTIPRKFVSEAPTINNTNVSNTQCNAKLTYSQNPTTNISKNINNINQSLANLQTNINAYSSVKYNITSANYTYSFTYTARNPGIYTIQSSCITKTIDYAFNKTNNNFTIIGISSFNVSNFKFKSITVKETYANISSSLIPIFNKTVIIPPTITIINNTIYNFNIDKLNISSTSLQKTTTHILVSNVINSPFFEKFNYTNSLIFNLSATNSKNLFLNFSSTYLSSETNVGVYTIMNNRWVLIPYIYSGSNYLVIPIQNRIIGIFIQAPSYINNFVKRLKINTTTIPANTVNITTNVSTTIPITVSNSNITNVSTTIPITVSNSNITNVSVISTKINKNNNLLSILVIAIIIIIAIIIVYYKLKIKNKQKKKNNNITNKI